MYGINLLNYNYVVFIFFATCFICFKEHFENLDDTIWPRFLMQILIDMLVSKNVCMYMKIIIVIIMCLKNKYFTTGYS